MLNDIVLAISNFMYTYLLIIILLAGGLYFTFRTRFIQFRMFRESLRVVAERPDRAGSVSSFQALMVSTASRVGTGNIIGVSVAICIGGYGAVFWMWLIAIIGGATAFIESTLARSISAATRRPARATAVPPTTSRRPSTAAPWRCSSP